MSRNYTTLCTKNEAIDKVLRLRSESIATSKESTFSLTDAFEDRTLAKPLIAERDIPEQSHATMDGFALDATVSDPYTVVEDTIFPEDDPPSLDTRQAVRIATGAPLPADANAVLKVEDGTVEDGMLTGDTISPGTYVYERASTAHGGETLFDEGEQLSPKDAILLRDIGYEMLTVTDPFNVGLLATGTEIHEGQSADLDSPMLAALIRSWGHKSSIDGTVPDDPNSIERAIETVAAERDVIITTGGTSVGKKDHVIRALDSLGEILFHQVRIRPGKPLAVARLPDHEAVAFAIPGKPVGAHIIASLVVRPFFTGSEVLPTVQETASQRVDVPTAGFEYAIPVTVADGRAEPLGASNSALSIYNETFDPSVVSSSTRATRADGFVLTETGFERNDQVGVVPHSVVE